MADYIIPETYQDKKDLLWINLIAREFDSQSGYARGNSSIQKGSRLGSWKLLAPTEIVESISHDWGEYESIGSRISQKTGEIKKGISEAKGLATGAANLKTLKGGVNSENAHNLISNLANSAASIQVPKYKIDTSMVYQNSKRREYSLTFNFAINGRTTYNDVFEPIRKLEELSCAELDVTNLINIKFPAIFKIYTWPGDLIKINNCVLTAVQPTWTAPFKDGYPVSCELQLTMQDIEPLYRKSFSKGGIITTS